jgi:hypothetical protein
MLQQTPADKAIGDVLFDSVEFVKIIEFKRSKNSSIKEKTKHKQLCRALNQSNNQHLLPVSCEIHWYIETENIEGKLSTKFSPYIDFINGLKEGELSTLISQTAHELIGKTPPRHSPNDYAAYLDLLTLLTGKRSASTGALVLWATFGGGLRYIPVAELQHIRFKLKDIYQKIDQKYQREAQLEKALEKTMEENYELRQEKEQPQSISRTLDQGIDRDGPDFDMGH